jgi:hypothetical protein
VVESVSACADGKDNIENAEQLRENGTARARGEGGRVHRGHAHDPGVIPEVAFDLTIMVRGQKPSAVCGVISDDQAVSTVLTGPELMTQRHQVELIAQAIGR